MLSPSILSSATYSAKATPDALVERTQLVVGVGVVEAEHPLCMRDGRETCGHASADALGRRIEGDELRMLGFEADEFGHQGVELGVGDLRLVEHVVALFVVPDEPPQFLDAVLGIHDAGWPAARLGERTGR